LIKNFSLELDTRLKVAEDLSFNMDYLKCADSVVIIDDCKYNYRIRSESLIHNVTLPTKQKYVLEHCLSYLSCFDENVLNRAFENNPKFLNMLWKFGILNTVQAAVLEKESYNYIYHCNAVEIALKFYKPQNKKDRLMHWSIQNHQRWLLSLMVIIQYKILLSNTKIYNDIKKIINRN
jgi:hypothetical protein